LPFSLPSLLHCRVQLQTPESTTGGETTFPSPVLLFSSPLPSLPLPLLSLRIRPLTYSQSVWGIAVSSQCGLKLSPSGNRILIVTF